MIETHAIRLAGPWQISRSEHERPQAVETLRQNLDAPLPESWQNQNGTLTFARNFNCPSGLTSRNVVWVEVDSFVVPERICLNESVLEFESLREEIANSFTTSLAILNGLKPGQNNLKLLFSGQTNVSPLVSAIRLVMGLLAEP